MNNDKLVVYIALGDKKYFDNVLRSVASLRSAGGYMGHVRLLTDMDTKSDLIDSIIQVNSDVPTPRFIYAPIKTSLQLYTDNFKRVLYLDSDTKIKMNLSRIWDIKGDLVLCPHPERTRTLFQVARNEWYRSEHMDDLMATMLMCKSSDYHFNAGVILFTPNKLTQFFTQWHNQWMRYKRMDQLALNRAIQIESPDLGLLPNEFNCPYPERRCTIHHWYWKELLKPKS